MKLLFSEFGPDYSHYRYPYVIWGVPGPGETPADLYAAGFHPASTDLSLFTLCRHLRVPLAWFEASAENRRILRKGEGVRAELIARENFDYSAERRAKWLAFAEERFGPGIMPGERLDGLMRGRVITHLLSFRDERDGGREVGTALMYLEPPRMAHYYYAFYDLTHANRSLGLYMMTSTVGFFREAGYGLLYLGTCYSERALYKAQFESLEFFNGVKWSQDMDELRLLVRRDGKARHLLEEPAFLAKYGDVAALARASLFESTIPDAPSPGATRSLANR